MYPCASRKSGCKDILSVAKRNDHRSRCRYQIKECPFKKLSNVECSWAGILSEIDGHVKSEHGDEIVEENCVFTVTMKNVSSLHLHCFTSTGK